FSPYYDTEPKNSVKSVIWEIIDTVKDNSKAVKLSVVDIFCKADNSIAELLHEGLTSKNYELGNAIMMTLTSEV
ncbi:unnamed protein product, partial [Allacma fusca]